MAKTHQVIIRMGAAHWDAQVTPEPGNTMHFDIRSMDRDQKRQFFQSFREAYRSVNKPARRHKRAKR